MQFCEGSLEVDFNEEKWSKDFAILQRDLWPKFLQVGLYELYHSARDIKNKISLASEEFEELPPSHLNNLSDYDLFEDFLQANMMIEVSRALKYQMMTFIRDKVDGEKKEEKLAFLQ